jgi:hypothetical protein
MIFDNGGPGISNLSRIDARYEDAVADAETRGFNLLILDEPWVVAPYGPPCQSAMASLYRESVRRYPRPATTGTAASVLQDCLSNNHPATTFAEDYRGAVDQIEQIEHVGVVRLEGYSFASVRAAYLGVTRPHLIAAVGSPFPVGGDAADFYSAVGATTGRIGGKAPRGGLVADSALAYYATTGALPQDMDQATAAQALWQVYTTGDLSLSRVGYYSEICASLTGWTGFVGRAHRNGSAVTALASVHAPCAAGGQPATLKLPAKSCFTVLNGDPNSPWVPSPLTRKAHIETVATGEHGKVRIPECH